MKKIDTIVEDIYNLFEKKNEELTEKEVDKCINDFANSVKVHVKDFLKNLLMNPWHLVPGLSFFMDIY